MQQTFETIYHQSSLVRIHHDTRAIRRYVNHALISCHIKYKKRQPINDSIRNQKSMTDIIIIHTVGASIWF